MAKKQKKKKNDSKESKSGKIIILTNKKVRHNYEIIDTYEAGLVLLGSEVKSIRQRSVQWGDAHASFTKNNELFLYGLHISEYKYAGPFNHEPTRARKLLLNRKEIEKMCAAIQTKGLALVPYNLYFIRGFAKIGLALVKGKKLYDKRQDMINKDRQRDMDRAMKRQ